MSRLRKSITFSNTVAVVALFFALGGTVYAASNKISGAQIKPKSLPGNRIKPQSVTGTQIKNGSIGAPQLKAGAVSASQIQTGSITGIQIKAGSIGGTQIQSGSINGTQIQSGSLGATQINQTTLTGVSAANIHTVQYVTATIALVPESANGTNGTATCPSGMKVIGGGATVNKPQLGIINEAAPNAERSGWSATGFTSEPGVTMTVTAICTPVATTTG